MSYGIDYDRFWSLNPAKLEPFIKAYQLRQEREYKTMDIYAWMQGAYFGRAIGAALSSRNKYPKQPLMSESEEKTNLSMMDKMQILATRINSRFAAEKEVNIDG